MQHTPALLDRLGRLLHEHYVAYKTGQGHTAALNPSLAAYEELPEQLRQSNRDTAAHIWERLATIGYGLIGRSDPGIAVPAAEILGHLEFLAELGHRRWMNHRISQGWSYAAGPKDLERRTSPSLVPWAELDVADQDYERQQVRDLPSILEAAALKMIRSRSLSAGWRGYEEDTAHTVPELAVAAPERFAPDWSELIQPSPELLMHIARELHENYIRHRVERGDSIDGNVALYPWEQLATLLQQSNLMTAGHLWGRLSALGYGIASLDASYPRVTEAEFAQDAETLAQLGHVCWMNDRFASGWTFAPGVKNVEAKTHPGLVPWQELPPEEQDKERQQIADLPGILATADLRIVRLPV